MVDMNLACGLLLTALVPELGLQVTNAGSPGSADPSPVTALVGGTVIDVSDAAADLPDATVLLSGGRVTAVGPRGSVDIPEGAEVVLVEGEFLTPGLMDCFAAINGQRHADAYLYNGVTSVVGVHGGRRGGLFSAGVPSPHVYRLESTGSEKADLDTYLADLDRFALEGVDVALLMYELQPDELRVLAARADELGLATIGELGRASYGEPGAYGLDAFVHTTRYSLDMAPAPMRTAVAAHPFSDDLASPKWQYYQHLTELGEALVAGDRGPIERHAQALAGSGAALIPTLSLLYLDMPWAENPWLRPGASIIDAATIHRPAGVQSGRHTDYDEDPPHGRAYGRLAEAVMGIEAANVAAGNRYLAGSATDVWGTMPGLSLHTELEGLVRAGLTPREALRAATWNPTETFGWKDRGRIAPGAVADILVLRDDPRANVAALQMSIETVYLAGRPVDRPALLKRVRGVDGEIVDQDPWPSTEGVAVSELTYMSDGLAVKAVLVEPRGTGSYPALVYCRGGNREFGAITPERARGFLTTVASWGYVVIAPQYRGNHGGEGLEEFGGTDVNDVLHVLPLLAAHPKADAERVGIYGGSRGGMMALLAMRRTERFAAAVLRCPLTDLVTWPDDRPGIETVYADLIPGYDPSGDPSDDGPLIQRSPVRWAADLPPGTPILIMQGNADWRVSPAATLRFAGALQAEKHPYRLVMMEGADHSLTGFTRERDALTKSWLDRYVRDGHAAPDMEPHGD